MKFVHIADMHFDSPFTFLSENTKLGEQRRLEQRKAFKKVIEYIKENNIDYLFISGDLFEHEYIKKTTVEYVNNLFKEIESTKIFIAPGNHDPYIRNSVYQNFTFNKNVCIFKDSLEVVEENDADIYGMGFSGFYMNETPLENINILNNNKIKILVAHADLNGAKDNEGLAYNPISERILKEYNFDYIALGHIHKNNYESGKNIIYPGSAISFGFDELGKHGMVVGEIENNKLKTEFITLDEREFTEIELNVENMISKEEIIENILEMKLNKNNLYKIILTGKRNFEINAIEILETISAENILKIKDKTKIKYDIEEISKENNLKGFFIREILKKMETGNYTEEEIEKAIEIGLNAM